ncbi:HNH endonuclease [Hymenobacter sp. DG01]|uniref:HNH endonuclease n=1 Tax=Hymenobacter sp. DG01 TaxID=2584940 RepID=UPI00111C9B93|nr:HNH endonuclease signature motif containing protein [Hymenobacter sp. DG01]
MCASSASASTTDRPDRKQQNQGQNWISQRVRLAIYMRDGFACAYCARGIEAGLTLTLDHIVPYSKGGAIKDPKNLITACLNCNSSRGNRSLKDFVAVSAPYHQRDPAEVLNFIRLHRQRVLKLKVAGQMIAQSGSCRKVLDIVQGGGLI